MAIQYTKRMFSERVRIHVGNNFPDSEMSLTENQVILYIDQVLATTLVGQSFAYAKLEGNICTPEAYLSTYNLTDIQQESNTGYWFVTLPQPPVSLPLGYSITDVYFAKTAFGKSDPILPIKNKRVSYRTFLPLPTGTRYWVEGSIMWLAASNNQPLLGQNLYVQMAKTRTNDPLEIMDIPDDANDSIFKGVIALCKERLGLPQDTIQDNLPAGSKNS